MQLKELKIRYRGKDLEGTVAVPEDLQEAVTALTEKEVWESFMAGYIERQKRRLKRSMNRPRKHIRVPLKNLSDEQIEGLKALGLLRD